MKPMAYKTILVHCDADRTAPARIELAATLAERNQAHLVGLHARPSFEPPFYDTGARAMDLMLRHHGAALKESEEASAQAFAIATKGKCISSEWRSATGLADDLLVVHARYADLVVAGQDQPEPATRLPGPSGLPENVALATGRGVLVVPLIGVRQPVGRNVMLCWNASRESARAATEALPLLKAADTVTVLVVEPRVTSFGHGAEPGADVAAWLSRHGVKVTVQREAAADADVGNVILSRVADHGSDLIVMGIYGRSRLREVILGGASRTLLSSMTVPVLMAH